MSKFKYYGILRGHKSNIVVSSWRECLELISDFENSAFRGFKTMREAEKYAKPVSVPCTENKEINTNPSRVTL